jgi:hypothetical protein
MTLAHEGNNMREFYSSLSGPVLVGIEATGSMARLTLVMAVATELLAGEIELRSGLTRLQDAR